MDLKLQEIKKEAEENNVPIMMDGGIEFLIQYIKDHKEIKHILEAGTAVGYSAINMAKIRNDIEVDTCEINEEMYKQALINIEEEGLSERIHVHLIDAVKYEPDHIYDLFFIDAAKAQYRRYTEHYLQYAKKGSVFVFDNLNFHGIVDDPSITHNRSTRQMVHKIKIIRDWIQEDERFDTTFYKEIGDGVAVAIYLGTSLPI